MMEVTRQDIDHGLRELGLSKGAVVEVHSSLSNFGHVVGGAATVVDALLDAVGAYGTVVMSSYPVSRPLPVTDEDRARGVTWKVRVLPDGSRDRTGMGTVVEDFCNRAGVVLGKGVHRVAAWGHHAERYAERGYQQLADVDGLALLMGVGIDRCSSLHLTDSVPLPKALTSYFTIPQEVRRTYPVDVCVGYHDETPKSPWDKAIKAMDRPGLTRKRRIGQADCMLFKIRPMLSAIESIVKRNPFGAFGLVDTPHGVDHRDAQQLRSADADKPRG